MHGRFSPAPRDGGHGALPFRTCAGARRGLALRAKVGTAPGDDDAADFCAAAKARLAGALIDAMARLKFSAIPFRVHVIGNRRTFHANRFVQNQADFFVQARDFIRREIGAEALRMNPRAPQGLIGVDIAHATERALIEQERLDAAAA